MCSPAAGLSLNPTPSLFSSVVGNPYFTAARIGLSLVSNGIQAIGAYRQANAASNQAEYNAQVAANNAEIANNNAKAALDKGNADSLEQRRRTRQRAGLQKAQLAAMGFDLASGSSIDILGDTAALGELDQLRIQTDAKNRANNFRNQANTFQTTALLGRFAAKSAKRTGKLRATSTLITGASRTASTFLSLRP